MPINITHEIYDQIVKINVNYWWNPFTDPKIAKLGMGRYLQEVDKNMKTFINKQNTNKLILCSAHDSAVAPLLAALNVNK